MSSDLTFEQFSLFGEGHMWLVLEAIWAPIKKKLKKRNCLTFWLVEYVSIFSGEIRYSWTMISFFLDSGTVHFCHNHWLNNFSDIHWCYLASMYIATAVFINLNVKIISNAPTAKFLLFRNSKIFRNLGQD